MREKAESKAEKQSNYYLACLWAENHINETFNAKIYKFCEDYMVVKYNTVEMTLPYEILGKRFATKKNETILVNKDTGEKYNLGEEIPISIAQVNKEDREIYVAPVLQNIQEKSV